MVKIAIHGANGKMGREIRANLTGECVLSAVYDPKPLNSDGEFIVARDLKELFDASDVVIDFSTRDGALALINYARTNPKPLVIGTTGLSDGADELIEHASALMPILRASNMSLGVAVLNKLVKIAAKTLAEFDAEILEMHHRHKKDAPSGTALTLAHSVARARGLSLDAVRVSGRDGLIGERKKDEIAVMSLRGGDIAGRHRVGFYEDGEYIELSHTATSRATFAKGAIKAAIWLASKDAGLYSIEDCLGL